MTLRTEQQRKDLCADCPVARVADSVGDSCTLLIIRDLMDGPKRYTDLETSLHGISSRTLTKKLRGLETDGLVTKKQTATRVEYRLTKKGAALQEVVDAMRSYGKRYL
ncbi:MAG: helix-turn-helix domain-containing protein [Candidatus Paceibacterota bacterium]